MIDVDAVRRWDFRVVRQTYSEKDTILYGLSLGYGEDPTNEDDLRFVYERGLVAVPTMATTLCHPGFWVGDPRTGIDAKMVVHGEHKMTFHAPLSPSATVRGETRVVDVIDKGKGKGAIVVSERSVFDDTTGTLIASIEQGTMCRGDGGFSAAPRAEPRTARPSAAPDPQRDPDHRVDIRTLPQAALFYRLCADKNPLHADPAVARAAGFDRPILHGLCTYGVAARAIIRATCGNDPRGLEMLSVRFSAPVFPGETIRTEIWRESSALRFRCVVPERNAVVITNGIARTRASSR
jgi:acyl dehydratase